LEETEGSWRMEGSFTADAIQNLSLVFDCVRSSWAVPAPKGTSLAVAANMYISTQSSTLHFTSAKARKTMKSTKRRSPA
jgi:hypothetical protein